MKALYSCAVTIGALCLFVGSAKAEVVLGEWTPAGETGVCGGGYSEYIDGVLHAYLGIDHGEVMAQTDTNCTTESATVDDPEKTNDCPGATKHRCVIAK